MTKSIRNFNFASLMALAALAVAAGVGVTVRQAKAAPDAARTGPNGSASGAIIAMRFTNPKLLQSNLQWIATRILVPATIPTMRAMESGLGIAGGLDNSKPIYLLVVPTGASAATMQSVFIFSAAHPHLEVSQLNPPAPVNGMSMVILKNGTTGYIALQKHTVLFATHRESLRMVLQKAHDDLPDLTGRARQLFNGSDVSISMNIHRLIKIAGPAIAAKERMMEALLRASPQGETSQQKLGLQLFRKLPGMIDAAARSVVGGIMVKRSGVAFTMLVQPPAKAQYAHFLVPVSNMHLSPVKRLPALPMAMALRMRAPYAATAKVITNKYEQLLEGMKNSGSTAALAAELNMYKFLARHPDGAQLKWHLFMIAPTHAHDPLQAQVQDFNAKHPGNICRMLLKAAVQSQLVQQNASASATLVKETPLVIDGVTFERAGVRLSPGRALTQMPRGDVAVSVFNDIISACYGSNTLQIAVGHVGDRVISALNLTPSQLKSYITYVKGGGVLSAKSAVIVQAQRHFLPNAFAGGYFDPAVLLGQLAATVNADAGMMRKKNAVPVGHTPLWALSISCMREKPEYKIFIPTDSMRVSSQQIQRMFIAAMTLFMQFEHPAAGA